MRVCVYIYGEDDEDVVEGAIKVKGGALAARRQQ